jgi:hypothetical protein
MIDKNKWEQASDEQKLKMCKAVNDSINTNAVSKEDWKLMFEFLLNRVQGEIKSSR